MLLKLKKINMSFISYSQNFEDFILWRALKHVKNGFYIDVGAYDPTEDSVTKFFYDSGWTGINIDPVTSYYEKFLLERPRDINLNILISDMDGEVDFYENNKTGISSAIEDNAKSWQKESNFEFKKLKKVAKTLDSVCTENKIGAVHFLKIDVEGFEINVLRGFSFNAVRPWIVLFESVAPTGKHEDISSDCVTYLKSKKYHQVYFDGLNKFFVSDEHSELDVAFMAPLNIFDNQNIQLNNSHWLIHSKLNELEQISEEKINEVTLEKQKIIDEIRTDLRFTKIQLDSTETELNSTKIQLDSTNTKLNSTKTQLDSTETKLNSTKIQLGLTETELTSTKTQLDSIVAELNSTKSQLESKNNELSEVYKSRGWKSIILIRRGVNTIIPIGSFRRKVVKHLLNLFKAPLKNKAQPEILESEIYDELKNLSPRARRIYDELNSAINSRKKQ